MLTRASRVKEVGSLNFNQTFLQLIKPIKAIEECLLLP